MGTEESAKAKPKRKAWTKILKSVLVLVVVLIVLVVFLVPAFVSSQKCRQIILAKINDSIGGKADFAGLSMSWRRGFKVTNFSFNDSAAQTSIEVEQIVIKPHYAWAVPLPIKKFDLAVRDGDLRMTGRGGETIEAGGINSRLTMNLPGSYPAGWTEKLLANLNVKAKLGFERAEYMGLNFGAAEADIQIQDGLLKIAPFSSTVNEGQFNFAGEADFKQKPILFRTTGPIQIVKDIQINDETTRKLLMYLNPIFANAVKTSGVANFSCERLSIPLGGDGEGDIEMVGTISIDQVRLEASDLLGQILSLVGGRVRTQDITVHPTRFVLQNGLLQYDDMQMDIGNNPVVFGGVIGLDKSLNMTVTLPYTTSGRTARVGKETEGVRISLPLKGTIDKPELDTRKLLEGQLKEQLMKELEKRLGEELLEELERLLKQ